MNLHTNPVIRDIAACHSVDFVARSCPNSMRCTTCLPTTKEQHVKSSIDHRCGKAMVCLG